MKRTIASPRVERRYRTVSDAFLAGTPPHVDHERHVHAANVLPASLTAAS